MTLQKKFLTNKKASVVAFVVGVTLAVGGSVFATSVGSAISVDTTLTVTGLSTFTAAFVSQASSTVVGAFNATGLSTLGNTVLGTGGFISAASSTVVGTLTVTGAFSASSTGIFSGGFITQASSTIGGVLTITGATTINGGVLAAGAVSNDFSGSTGTFKTSTGAVTIGSGAVTVSGATTFSSTAAIGSSGTAMTQVLNGTCNPLMRNGKGIVAASSTLYMDCAVTGVVSGDKVFVQMPPAATSTINATSTQGGWVFIGAVASTTNGYITLAWQNRVGQATNIPSCGSTGGGNACGTTVVTGATNVEAAKIGLGSSTQYWIVR